MKNKKYPNDRKTIFTSNNVLATTKSIIQSYQVKTKYNIYETIEKTFKDINRIFTYRDLALALNVSRSSMQQFKEGLQHKTPLLDLTNKTFKVLLSLYQEVLPSEKIKG